MARKKSAKTFEPIAIRRIEEAKRIGAIVLNLVRLGLTSLPEEIRPLTALITLDLRSNRLTSLPEVIGQLTALTTLDLSYNQLTSLPEEIGQLTALTTLDLRSNRLTSLPKEIGQLTALTTLSLFNNRLTSLPEEIGQLTALTTLDLRSNQLTSLPKEIGQLPNLKELYLHGNERLGLPPEVLGPQRPENSERNVTSNPTAILAYYFVSQQKGKRPLAEAKVLVVGQGSVGKTSLIKYWLTGKACDGSEEKTTKIDISHPTLSIPCPDGKKNLDVALNVWDFGGQEIYHATHQFFLTKRSLYLLVLDARQTVDQNNLHYWFQVIRSFGGDSPVLVAINKSEQHRLELDETRLRKDYGEQFVGVVRVSCKEPFGRDELTTAIRTHLAKLKDVFNELPIPYFDVKAKLEEKAKKENFLPYDSYKRLCNKHELTEVIDQTTLIRFLHDLGVVLNFDDPENPYKLKETTILNPEWVTRGVYAIINNNELMQKQGVLNRDHFNRILSDKEYPEERKPVIIGMMHRFELCFDFPGEEGKKWLVPELLSANEPDLDWREHESLNFQYHYGVLPSGLISRFIVRTHTYLTKSPTYWKSGVVLEIEGLRTFVRGDTARGRVFITVQGTPSRRREALAVVRSVFRAIHATVPGLVWSEKVPLPDHPDLTVDFKQLIDYEDLGEEFIIPEGIKKRYRVRDLLDGVTTPKERDEERAAIHNHFHGVTKVNQNSGNNNVNVTNSSGVVLSWGTISGNVTNLVKQLPTKRKDGPDLKAVLDTFLAALREATEKQQLPAEDAKDAIEEVEVIAEAATKPDEPKMLEKANKAVRGLGRIVAGVSALATKATELGETVTGWFS